MATLREVLGGLDDLADDLTVYSQTPWTPDSEAVVANEPKSGGVPPEAAGMAYLLEVSLAQEVLEVWSQWRDGAEPSSDQRLEAVIYYAENDAYLPM